MARRSLRRRSPKFEPLEEKMLLSMTVIGHRAALHYRQHDHALAPEKPTAAAIDLADANHPIVLHTQAPERNDLAVARASKHHRSKLTRKPHHHKPRTNRIGRGSGGAAADGGLAGATAIHPVNGRSSGGSSTQPDGGGSTQQTRLLVGSYTGSYAAKFTNTSTNVAQQITGTITLVIGHYDGTTGDFSGSLVFTNVPGAGTMTQQITGVYDGFYIFVNGPADRDLSVSGSVNSASAIELTAFVGSNSLGAFAYADDGVAPPVLLAFT